METKTYYKPKHENIKKLKLYLQKSKPKSKNDNRYAPKNIPRTSND